VRSNIGSTECVCVCVSVCVRERESEQMLQTIGLDHVQLIHAAALLRFSLASAHSIRITLRAFSTATRSLAWSPQSFTV